jgi:hypothetical protein
MTASGKGWRFSRKGLLSVVVCKRHLSMLVGQTVLDNGLTISECCVRESDQSLKNENIFQRKNADGSCQQVNRVKNCEGKSVGGEKGIVNSQPWC